MMIASTSAPPATASRRVASARKALCWIAVAAALPYLVLKIAWVCGSTFGIDDPGHADSGSISALNSVTIAMELVAVTSALALSSRWGRRLPPWIPVLPMWIGAGLLGTVLLALPFTIVTAGGGSGAASSPGPRAGWQSTVVETAVNGGIMVQGLTLIPLFILYVRERWGHLLRGRVADLPDHPIRPVEKLAAGVALLVSVLPITMHFLWLVGVTAGQNAALTADGDSMGRALDGASVLMGLSAVTAGVILAHRRPRRRPLALPLALGWFGAGSMVAWGGWLSIAALIPLDKPDGPRFPPLAEVTYSAQLVVGLLVFFVGSGALVSRSALSAGQPVTTDAGP